MPLCHHLRLPGTWMCNPRDCARVGTQKHAGHKPGSQFHVALSLGGMLSKQKASHEAAVPYSKKGLTNCALWHFGKRRQRTGRTTIAQHFENEGRALAGCTISSLSRVKCLRQLRGYQPHQDTSQDLQCRQLSFSTCRGRGEKAALGNCGRRATLPQPDSMQLTMSQAMDAGYKVLTTCGCVVPDILPLGLMPIVHRLS